MLTQTRVLLLVGAVRSAAGGCDDGESAILLSASPVRLRRRLAQLERLSAGLNHPGRQLRAISRSHRRRMAHLERLSPGLYGAGRQLCALSGSSRLSAAWMVRLLSFSLSSDANECRRARRNFAAKISCFGSNSGALCTRPTQSRQLKR